MVSPAKREIAQAAFSQYTYFMLHQIGFAGPKKEMAQAVSPQDKYFILPQIGFAGQKPNSSETRKPQIGFIPAKNPHRGGFAIRSGKSMPSMHRLSKPV